MLLAAIVALQVVKFCGITYSAKVETAMTDKSETIEIPN
jgi:hypothetical protein